MRCSYVVFQADGVSHQLDTAHRDWCLLDGPFFSEGEQFVRTLGVYENHTVSGGIPKGSFVVREKLLLLQSTKNLLRAVQRDEELLRYDYTYSFSSTSRQRNSGGQSGFRVRGLIGSITTRPHGFCMLELRQLAAPHSSRLVELIDMRIRNRIETDELGTLKIHRRKAAMYWLDTLPPAVEFLNGIQDREVKIEHYSNVTV